MRLVTSSLIYLDYSAKLRNKLQVILQYNVQDVHSPILDKYKQQNQCVVPLNINC